MHFGRMLPGREPFSRIRQKMDAYGAILASQGPVAVATRGAGTRAACGGRNADGGARWERCGWRSAGGDAQWTRCGRDCRSARAAQWARQAHGHGAGARGAVDARLRQACRHGPELCRHDARGHRGALSARCAWSRSRDATGAGRRRGQNYSPKRASITATRSFSTSMSC